MGSSDIFASIGILILLFISNAFFAGSEIAILSVNQNKIKKQAEKGSKEAQLLIHIISAPANFLATIQVGVTLSGLLASAVAAEKFADLIVDYFTFLPLSYEVLQGLTIVLITVILSYFTLIFGELVPKRIAMKYSDKIALSVACPIWIFYKVAKPFVVFLAMSTNFLLRLLGIGVQDEAEEVTEEDILLLVEEGQEKGCIEEDEQEMIEKIFELDDMTISQIMTHRTHMLACSKEESIESIIKKAQESGYSRIPIYEETLDKIVGILYVKDLLQLVFTQDKTNLKIEQYMRPPIYIPESKKCSKLLKEFQEKKIHMAIVLDEYGGTEGIVTMEDLLEVIVGNIQDEYDLEAVKIEKLAEDAYILDGSVSIEEVERILDVDLFEGEDCETIGGFIIKKIGMIPQKDSRIKLALKEGYELSVLEVDEKCIKKVNICKVLA
ncbi:MAG: hemolysin family protein [Candidatus Niameybacter stercoravium]|nr:hemolysin family protein [Candidatus Niameybacter stercoravium]